MPYINDFDCWIDTPKHVISEVVSNGYIYDEYLNGIEELVKMEASLHSEEILEENLDAYKQDPTYSPTILSTYRNFTDDDGYATWFVRQELPSLIRGSALVTLFSIFEDNIKYICNHFLSFTTLNISYADLSSHRALDKFKIALKILGDKILDDDKPFYINKDLFNENSYRVIKDAQIIRHCFAHANGQIKIDDAKIIKKNNLLTKYFNVTNDFRIIIEKGALIFVSDNMRVFFNSLLKD